jgi:alanyl-tRNA synthetase
MLCQISDKLINKGVFAGNVVKEASQIAGGNGGGRKDFAQAGGKDTSKVDEILTYVSKIVGA